MREPLCGLRLAEEELGERRFRPPWEVAGAGDSRPVCQVADCEQIGQTLLRPSLRDTQAAAREEEDGCGQGPALGLRVHRREGHRGFVELALLDEGGDRMPPFNTR